MLWLYLHFPQLQLDLLNRQTETSSQASKAVVIIEKNNNRIVQASQAAKQQGIELGMGLATAIALYQQLNIFEYRPDIESQYLQQLAQQIYNSSSGIVIDKPNGLILETSSMLLYHQGLENYWRTIQKQLFELRVNYSTAYSPIAAKLLAQSAYNHITKDKNSINRQVDRLSCQNLPLAAKKIAQLQRLGIQTLGKLRRIPLKELAKRFDIELLKLIGQINNELKTPLLYFQPKTYFHHYLQLFYEIDNADQLINPLKKTLQQLEFFLRQHNATAEIVELILHQRGQSPLTLNIHSAQGLSKADDWQSLCSLRFERVQLQTPVDTIEVYCRQYQQQGQVHKDLFDGDQQQGEAQGLIDQLQARLGKHAVYRLNICDSHIPEQANRYLSPQQALKHIPLSPSFRPSFLYQKPQALPPQELQKLLLLHGPERIQSQWWQQEIQRDYYIARSSQGSWCWIFKDSAQRWFMQGYFA